MIKTKTTSKIAKAAKLAKPAKKAPAKKPSFSLPGKNPAKPIILAVIGLAGLMVIMATFSAFFFTPEKVVKDEIESLAKNYYANKIYENIINTNASDINSGKKSLDSIMEKYARIGFSRVSLRQLLLVGGSHPNTTAIVTKYCNENNTSLIFFPDPPYGKEDYHISYTYDCKF